MKQTILFKHPAPVYRAALKDDFDVVDFDLEAGTPSDDIRRTAKVLVTSGSYGAYADEIDALPGLELVCCVGTGYDRVDLDACRARGIRVTHSAGTNAEGVADHAIALLLAALRDIPRYDAQARSGAWRPPTDTRPTANGRPIGILGMGAIGKGIARRAEAFNMPVFYTARSEKPDLPWTYAPSVLDMAAAVDFLIVAAPGGAETHHLIDAPVLKALGPEGFLVNIGRGTVIDTAALVAALKNGDIMGAGIDVYEDEPNIPADLIALKNIVLTPHVGGMLDGVHALSAELMRRNLDALFAGEPLISPIPEMAG